MKWLMMVMAAMLVAAVFLASAIGWWATGVMVPLGFVVGALWARMEDR